ncbi:LOW QUALITY PROTEIN: leucine-rich repeat and IQ domain-containing protein 4 [Pluvialis apricaria]
MAESQQSQEASAGGSYCPKADSVGFEDDCDQTAQEIPVNEVAENEALSPTGVTDRMFLIELANEQLRTVSPGVLSLDLEELHMEKNLTVSIPRDINCPRHMKVLYLGQNHIQDICEELGKLKYLLSLDFSNSPLSCSSLPVISKLRSLRQLRLYKTHLKIPVQTCEHLHHVEPLGLSDNNLKCLPKEIVNLTKLKELYLQKNRFENFPKELCHIDLEIRDLEQNLISLIPEKAGFLTNLVKLFLAFNNLSSIPPTLQRCQKLAVLDLSHTLLHKLPPGLKNLTEMRLRLSANSLEKFLHQICRWPSPSCVYLRNTAQVPGSFTRLTRVSILDLSENCFDEIHKGTSTMENLEVLALDDNRIQQVTFTEVVIYAKESLSDFIHLNYSPLHYHCLIDIIYLLNDCVWIPAEVKELTNLKCLCLSENQFSIFPKEIFLLESLETYLGQDKEIKFTSLPEAISKLQHLKELHMENNCLAYLPAAIGSLTHLKIPDCHNNLLKQLPDSVCQIQDVHYMHRLNFLCTIHVLFTRSMRESSTSFLFFVLQLFAFVGSGLQKMHIQKNNHLSQQPEDLGSLQQLGLVLVDGNPMTDPPTEVCCQGASAIWEYLGEKRYPKKFVVWADEPEGDRTFFDT